MLHIYGGRIQRTGKKLGVSAKGKLKLGIFHRYPDSSWAEPGAGITGKAWERLLILQ